MVKIVRRYDFSLRILIFTNDFDDLNMVIDFLIKNFGILRTWKNVELAN